MLFRQKFLDGIRNGTVTVAFRKWHRPSVRTGGTLLTGVGQLTISSVARITLQDISPADAGHAGYDSLEELLAELRNYDEGDIYRIDLGPLRPDPRIALREVAAPADEDRLQTLERIRRLDDRSAEGPWVLRTLQLIQSRPGVRASTLCRVMGQERDLFFAGFLHQLRRDVRLAQEFAEETIVVSNTHGLVLYQAMATIVMGWTLIEERREEAIKQMREGLAAHLATGTGVLVPHFSALLAEGLGKALQVEEGLELVDRTLASHPNGDRYYQAELYRLKGELLLAQSAGQTASDAAIAAENCFHESVEISRRQKAKSLELRAALSLTRLHRNLGRQAESQDLLAQIYGKFTEGFDTADLQEAKSLLKGEL